MRCTEPRGAVSWFGADDAAQVNSRRPAAADGISARYTASRCIQHHGVDAQAVLRSDFRPKSMRRPDRSVNSLSGRKKARPGWAPGFELHQDCRRPSRGACRLERRSQTPPARGCGAGCKSRSGFREIRRCPMRVSLLASGHDCGSMIRYCRHCRATRPGDGCLTELGGNGRWARACVVAWQAAREREGNLACRRNWRVANPPQIENLPHKLLSLRCPDALLHRLQFGDLYA